MKEFGSMLLLAGALMLGGCTSEEWRDQHGEALAPADLEDRWGVVNYWAEWCAPCLHELPEFNRLAETRPDVLVLGVNFDGVAGEELRELSERMDIRFQVMGEDFEQSMKLERPQVLPTTYVFDPQGALRHSLAGPQTEETLLAVLE